MEGEAAETVVVLTDRAVIVGADLLVQSTLLISAGLLLAWLLRRQGAALQAAILRVTLAAQVLCPLAAAFMRKAGLTGAGMIRIDPAAIPSLPPVVRELAPIPIGAADPTPPDLPVLSMILAALWGLGAGALLFRLLIAHVCMVRLRRRAHPAPTALRKTCQDLARLMHTRTPLLLTSPTLKTPCLHGVFRPAILLPGGGGRVTGASREILLHELAHLLRHDCAWNLMGRIACAALFFQPLVWILARRVETVSDDVADDYVVGHGSDRRGYARQLVDLAERLQPVSFEAVAGAGVIGFKSSLGRRIQRLLESTSLSTRVGVPGVAVTILVGFGLMLVASLVGAVGEREPAVDAGGARTGEGRELKKELHPPFKQDTCAPCHPEPGVYDERNVDRGACFQCHEHRSFREKLDKYEFLHGPIAVMDCLSCHDPHESIYPRLLRDPVPKLCVKCHVTSQDVPATFHQEMDTEDCTSCHDPHGGSRSFLRKGKGER